MVFFSPRWLKSNIFAVFLLLVNLADAGHHKCPMDICSGCLPVEVHDAPGVGFDLTTSYGTSAVHMHDGSIIDVAKVPGNPEYLELMERLANFLPPTPRTKLSMASRWLNKRLGLPSTPNVGILSRLITDLYKATKATLPSHQLDRVVVTTPLLLALTQEVLNDAIEYAGLRSWLIYRMPYPSRLAESRAVYAGNGNGLCKNYQNLYDCKDEEMDMRAQTVYTVTFARHALYTSLDTVKSPFGFTSIFELYLIDFESGLNTGETATNNKFQGALKDALAEIIGPNIKTNTSSGEMSQQGILLDIDVDIDLNLDNVADPVFAAARGAALYARRRQEVPWNCAEEAKCEEERQRVRQHRNSSRVEL